MTPLGRYALETVVTLLAIVGLAVGVLYLARRGGMGRPTGPLRLVGRLTLEPRRSVYLVRIGDLLYVIGASEAGLAKLGELPADSLPAAALDEEQVAPRAFAELLRRTRSPGGAPDEPAAVPRGPS